MTLEDYDEMYGGDGGGLLRVIKGALWGLAVCALVWLLTGCAVKTKVVEVPQVHTEYVARTDTLVRRDSVFFKDSVFVVQRGDTIYHNAYHTIYKDRYLYNTRTDTLCRTDTVTVVKTVEVEKRQGWWARMRDKINGGVVFLFAVVIGACVYWHVQDRR